MPENELVEASEQNIVHLNPAEKRIIEIPGAPMVRLQTLDLARHIAIAPDDKRYIVATFDDSRMGRDIVTAVFPQQNGYMTLVRLPLYEYSTKDPEAAIARHKELVQIIQQGKLRAYLQENQ